MAKGSGSAFVFKVICFDFDNSCLLISVIKTCPNRDLEGENGFELLVSLLFWISERTALTLVWGPKLTVFLPVSIGCRL